jgi:hypothetical protein
MHWHAHRFDERRRLSSGKHSDASSYHVPLTQSILSGIRTYLFVLTMLYSIAIPADIVSETWYDNRESAEYARDTAYAAAPYSTDPWGYDYLNQVSIPYKQHWCSDCYSGTNPKCKPDTYGNPDFRPYRHYSWVARFISQNRMDVYVYSFCQYGPEVTCPVPDLKFEPKEGSCTDSLEKGKGKDILGKCQDAPIMNDPKGWPCLVNKANGLGINDARTQKPESAIRTPEYQGHFVDIWKKWQDLEELKENNPEQYAACVTEGVVDRIRKHKDEYHGITDRPAQDPNDAPHVNGNAVDTGNLHEDMQNNLDALTCSTSCWLDPTSCTPTCQSIQGYLDDPTWNGPACNLNWGGLFNPRDPVHWQTR